MLIKKQQKENKAIKSIKAHVKHSFVWIKNRFATLQQLWVEEPKQLNALVWVVICAYNMKAWLVVCKYEQYILSIFSIVGNMYLYCGWHSI